MRLPEDTIAAIVEEVAATQLGVGDRLARVRVRRDVDHYGGPILRLRLLFKDETLRLDPQRTSGLPYLLVQRFDAEGEEAFPIVSYVSRPDWDEAALAAE